MSKFITLTAPEVTIATAWGKYRNKYSQSKGHIPLNNQPKDKIEENDILGSLCEMAACKFLNVYWKPTILDFVDIHPDIQVRGTKNQAGDLIIRFKDDPNHRYVLISKSLQLNTFLIHGWIYGHEGKISRYLKVSVCNRPPAYFIPQSDLYPIENLKI